MSTHYRLALPLFLLLLVMGCSSGQSIINDGSYDKTLDLVGTKMVALGYNDLGMHCMNQDFSEIGILPPFNNLYAQIILRGEEPEIVTSGVTVQYSIPGNTHSADKTNFWDVLHQMGYGFPNDVGLTHHKLSGTMSNAPGRNDWVVTGLPLTPITDAGETNPYQLASINVTQGGVQTAISTPVVPVSTEMSCDLCHYSQGLSTAGDILKRHDQLHGTSFQTSTEKPIVCGRCHRQEPLVPLGITGVNGLPTLSAAMHNAHAPRMGPAVGPTNGVVCYACHPGIQTQCQRDIHASKGMNCYSCHGQMADVADPTRKPWIDEPSCGSCHAKAGFEFEQANTLYRDSVGHSNVHCEACHGSPHAITPTITAPDNQQAIYLQGHAGTINTCAVCHIQTPDDSFFHRVSEDGGGGGSEGGGGGEGGDD